MVSTMQKLTETAIKNLVRRGFDARFFKTPQEALDFLLGSVGSCAVGIGGSMTVRELGWFAPLSARGETIWHWEDASADALERENAAPCYLTSANAVSAEGAIINIDGNGNRVCATSFGRGKKVFFVCGENKVERDLASAVARARNVAAPKNASRLARKTPCAAKADACRDCLSPERICRVMSVTEYPIPGMEFHILFIAGSWGY